MGYLEFAFPHNLFWDFFWGGGGGGLGYVSVAMKWCVKA